MLSLSENVLRYTIFHLLRIAGLRISFDNLKIVFNREKNEVSVNNFENRQIIFKLMNESEIVDLLKFRQRFDIIESSDRKVNVPIFYTKDTSDFVTFSDAKLYFNADIVTLSFIMLSRFEEVIVSERDKFDRFKFLDSLAYNYSFIDIPIVDEYAMLIRKWISKYYPNIEIHIRKGLVIPTHDIDGIQRFANIFRSIKTIVGGDIYNRRSLSLAIDSFKQYLGTIKSSKNDPFMLAIEELIKVSQNAGLCSEFYFLGQRLGQNDARYDIFNPHVKYCIDLIKDAGMLVGIHGGIDSYNDEAIFRNEKESIEFVYGRNINLGRQHFLKFDINRTIQVWQNFGDYKDSTLGYSERVGFRCGTCHEYFLYDFRNDTISNVMERPLIVMDKTLFDYSELNNEEAFSKVDYLYERCQAVEGDFVILWHNAMVSRDYETWFTNVYCKLLEKIS